MTFLPAYTRAVDSYETLIQEIRTNLDGAHQDFLDQSLEEIRHIMPQDANREQLTTPNSEDIPQRGTAAVSSPTYVGKASDIHFIHSIRQCVQGREQFAGEDALAQNYSETHVSESLAALKHPLLFPSPAEADQFLEVYLSTIHIAYPFISKSGLLEAFRRFQAKDVHKPEFRPWLAMFNFVFAIGSYYTSFPQGKNSSTRDHYRYYDQGLYYSRELNADCSLMNIWVLLVQCFFLLAVCHTDRCWNTLGFAIRMGQSIGLHVESSTGCKSEMDRANWRRTWYSMYVLDRLLALQLGRPMAIHEADFHVELPSAIDEAPWGSLGNEGPIATRPSERGCMMEYFLEVIRFSHIVGLVIRGLYQPSQVDLSPDIMLHSASGLDRRLNEWKDSLPRNLRFDLGHTFEKSISFKRQVGASSH
ncbi:hypothetical protein N7508_011032 [Penicillium antarcticum]|uniref:uncharacterized protein n=1 Tax=Penicillium antarcticum TaxID=416450 RepID=UPI00239F87C4|nr:uncharacterized protein N7508_011032 [Penicillium antarcticum]KAJ5296211.1 hypothetical protein N7508_011032 [Penicillium antarcticum]